MDTLANQSGVSPLVLILIFPVSKLIKISLCVTDMVYEKVQSTITLFYFPLVFFFFIITIYSLLFCYIFTCKHILNDCCIANIMVQADH